LYCTDAPINRYSHLVTGIVKTYAHLKGHLSKSWDYLSLWETLEPSEHRNPVPLAVAVSIISVALFWGWFKFGAMIIIQFFGICRPIEPLRSDRGDLVLPSDVIFAVKQVVYLSIRAPKSRNTGGARTQYASIENPVAIAVLEAIFGFSKPGELLWGASGSTLRKRWDTVCKALELPDKFYTPGGLRGGGAVYFFQLTNNIELLMWRMRVQSRKTLEHYLQEVVAGTSIHKLPSECIKRIALLSQLWPKIAATSIGLLKETRRRHGYRSIEG
jgi:hypothetical protein